MIPQWSYSYLVMLFFGIWYVFWYLVYRGCCIVVLVPLFWVFGTAVVILLFLVTLYCNCFIVILIPLFWYLIPQWCIVIFGKSVLVSGIAMVF